MYLPSRLLTSCYTISSDGKVCCIRVAQRGQYQLNRLIWNAANRSDSLRISTSHITEHCLSQTSPYFRTQCSHTILIRTFGATVTDHLPKTYQTQDCGSRTLPLLPALLPVSSRTTLSATPADQDRDHKSANSLSGPPILRAPFPVTPPFLSITPAHTSESLPVFPPTPPRQSLASIIANPPDVNLNREVSCLLHAMLHQVKAHKRSASLKSAQTSMLSKREWRDIKRSGLRGENATKLLIKECRCKLNLHLSVHFHLVMWEPLQSLRPGKNLAGRLRDSRKRIEGGGEIGIILSKKEVIRNVLGFSRFGRLLRSMVLAILRPRGLKKCSLRGKGHILEKEGFVWIMRASNRVRTTDWATMRTEPR